MPIDRNHAFANGRVFARSTAWLPPWQRRGAEGQARSAWTQFDHAAQVAAECLLGPNAWAVNSLADRSFIRLDEGVVCRGLLRIEQFGAGRIVIQTRAYIGDDCLLSSSAGIEIGAHAMLAHGVQIFDNDSHPLDPAARADDYASVTAGGPRQTIASAPVRIGAHVWIGFNVIILKGVTVGENSVVAAGSVVTKEVPACTVVAGNPARVIRELPSS
jgi:acetyltransferase-like isoleucine patch superfamily enzyme